MTNNPLVKPSAPPAVSVPFALTDLHARRDFASTSSHATPQPLTAINLLRGLRRRWKWAVATSLLLGAVSAALVWLFLPPSKPSAFAKIYFLPVSVERTRYEPADMMLKEITQKELILSRTFLGKVVSRPEVAELESIKDKGDPIAWLSRELSIDITPGAEIIKFSLQGDRPEELQTIITVLKNTYLQELVEEAESRRVDRERYLQRTHDKALQEYNEARRAANQRNVGIGSVDPQTLSFMRRQTAAQLATAEGELRTVHGNVLKLKRQLDFFTKKKNEPIDVKDASNDSQFLTDDEVVALSKARKTKEDQLVDRKSIVDPAHPSVLILETQLKSIQTKLEARKNALLPIVQTRFTQQMSVEIDRVKEELGDAEAQELTVQHRVDRFKEEANELKNVSTNVDSSYKDLQKMKAKVDEYELALEREQNSRDAPQRARTLEEALIVRPNEASRKMKFALGSLAGVFFLTILGFAFAEYRMRRIVSADEVVNGLGMAVMGTVPSKPARVTQFPSSAASSTEQALWEHLINESIDSARTLFLHTADANALRVIMITSAVGGEGKTLLSCQLAHSLARSGRRVLLIDGDLRSPTVHDQFGEGVAPGVCEYLRSELGAASLVRPTKIPNLFFLAAGQCEVRAVRQLAMDGFRRLIEDVRGQFDFVLIDSSPILPVADALLMSRHVDGVLLALMCDYSQIERVQSACQKLASIGAHVIGAVIHGINADTYGYGPRYLLPVHSA